MANDLTTARKPRLPSPKMCAAVDAMVWQGCHRNEAAKLAGVLPKSLYFALTKPHVKRYYAEQLQVLRESERARNIHSLVEVRDQKENRMASVQAVKALEQLTEPRSGGGGVSVNIGFSAGYVIDIAERAALCEVIDVAGSDAGSAADDDESP